MSEPLYGPNPCQHCGGEYGEHDYDCVVFLRSEIDRLKAGRFTDSEFHGLCHTIPESRRTAFCDGCDEYQRKLFGTCRTDQLRNALRELGGSR